MISNLDGIYKAVGEELTKLSGYLSTRLTAAMSKTDVIANVESTIDWPATGTLAIEGEQITYTGKTPLTFTGLTRAAGKAAIHPIGAAVADAGRTYSQLDELRHDQLVRHATGPALDLLGWNRGERRPLDINDTSCRALWRILFYLERGLAWSLYRVLRECLAQWVEVGAAATNPATPNRLFMAPGDFTAQHVGRPVEIGGLVYRIREIDPAAGAWADLYPARGPWWCAGCIGDGTAMTYTIQPFRITYLPESDPGWVLLDVFLHTTVLPPPSYLLDDPVPAVSPPGWVIGSETLTNELVPDAGYFPWYLPGLADDSAFSTMLSEVVPAGVGIKITTVTA